MNGSQGVRTVLPAHEKQAHTLRDRGQDDREDADDDRPRDDRGKRHGRPIAEGRPRTPQRLPAESDQGQPGKRLGHSHKSAEGGGSPEPAMDGEIPEVSCGHPQQEDRADGESYPQCQPASGRRKAEQDRPVQPDGDTRQERHLEKRNGELAECRRLFELPLARVSCEE